MIVPDLKRCQAEWTKYNAFVMGGPTKTSGRCDSRAVFIAFEKDIGEDGKVGSMTLCAHCREILDAQVAIGKVAPVLIKKLK